MIVRVAVVCVLVVACGDNGPALPDAGPPREQVALVPVRSNPDVDVLFVIDDSPAFLDEQTGLKSAFPAFVAELARRGDLPGLHLGVITSDVGTLGALDAAPGPDIGGGPGSCSGTGKGGALQTNQSSLINGAFIIDTAAGDGTRSTNYTGTFADAFRAIASVGSSGCGFEQHLHALKRALDNHPANVGFVRRDAALAIIIFTDEDDCSFAHSTFLSATDPTLGPLQSFRCTQFGVLCDDGGATVEAMGVPGIKTRCRSNEDSPHVMPLAGYAEFVRGLKADPRRVLVATISGNPTPFEVQLQAPPGGGGDPVPGLKNVCVALDPIGPSVRLPQLPTLFARGTCQSICTTDLEPPLTAIAREVRGMLGDSCLTREIALPADCVVSEQTLAGEMSVPPCSATTATDCYQLVEDVACTTSHRLRVDVTRSAPAAADTMVAVRCRT